MLETWIHPTRGRTLALIAAAGLLASACSTSTPGGPATASGERTSTPAAAVGPSQALIDAAVLEGSLTTIALPHDWCNNGAIIAAFKDRYGIPVNELDPQGSTDDQISAIKASKGNPGLQAPDVIDVIQAVGVANRAVFAPYKVSTWDSIPAQFKDPEGAWSSGYYGILSFETNTSVVPNPPRDWSDLLKPEYKGKVALPGDPRLSNQASQGVYAAALASGGSLDDARPGLGFMKRLADAGNLSSTIARTNTVDQGITPITIRWTYTALTHRDTAAGAPSIEVTVPATGRIGSAFVQAINLYAPHPNAAKLWMEFLSSDEGQNLRLKANCTPTRYEEMVARGAIPEELVARQPDTSNVAFPTQTQLEAAKALIGQSWDSAVGPDITDQ